MMSILLAMILNFVLLSAAVIGGIHLTRVLFKRVADKRTLVHMPLSWVTGTAVTDTSSSSFLTRMWDTFPALFSSARTGINGYTQQETQALGWLSIGLGAAGGLLYQAYRVNNGDNVLFSANS